VEKKNTTVVSVYRAGLEGVIQVYNQKYIILSYYFMIYLTKNLDKDEAEELMKYLHTQVSPLKPFF
jgi:hypothetical protein